MKQRRHFTFRDKLIIVDAWPGDTYMSSTGNTWVFTGLGQWERVK